jgi:16S rRNA processing protein RimM
MLLVVGRVSRPHGIRGDVVVEVRTDDPGQRFASGCVLATQPEALGPLTVAAARPHAGGLIVSFTGVCDRDAAARLRGAWLVIDSADVPAPADPDEFYDHQLIGLGVVTADGCHVGTVADVLHHGQDLLVIRPGDHAAEILVPFVSALVPEVDLQAGRLVIDPPPGLLDSGAMA